MVNAKTSLTGPILLAVLSLLVGVKGLIHARAAWLQHTVVWESLGRGAPRTWMDPRQAAVFWSLIILFGFSWLVVAIYRRLTDTGCAHAFESRRLPPRACADCEATVAAVVQKAIHSIDIHRGNRRWLSGRFAYVRDRGLMPHKNLMARTRAWA